MDISELAELRSTKVAELFPSLSLCKEIAIREDEMDRRARNCLQRKGCSTWGAVAALSIGELWMMPNAGRLTVEKVLAAARDMASSYREDWLAADYSDTTGKESPAPAPPQPSPQCDALIAFLEELTEWAVDAQGNTTIGELLARLNDELPSDLTQQFNQVCNFRLTDVLPTAAIATQASGLIIDFLDSVGPDARFVVERHIASPTGRVPTLESIAEREGLSRERVRQIIKRGLERVADLRSDQRFRLLTWRAHALRDALGSACSIQAPSANRAIEDAADALQDPPECRATEFMLWFAGEYRSREGFWILGETGRLEDVVSNARLLLADEWLLRENHLLDVLAESGVRGEISDSELEMLTAWRSIGEGWWVRWDGSVADKAEQVLRLALRAIGPTEMNERIGDGHAKSYIQNVLSADDRFARVSLDLQFALTEWGWEEYSSAAQEIAERIERAGGEAVLAEVIVELVNQFGLKESTIQAYAASPAFVVSNGKIRLRGEDDPLKLNDRISSVEGLYIRPDECVVFHIRVDADVLRGSGRSIPNPLAIALEVFPGGTRDFTAMGLGSIRVSWPITAVTGAAIGSTRALAEQLGAKTGDTLRLVFDPRTATVSGSLASGQSLSDLTGLVLTPGRETEQLSLALRVNPSEVRSLLNERGDALVASLLPNPGSSRALEQALSGIEDLLGG